MSYVDSPIESYILRFMNQIDESFQGNPASGPCGPTKLKLTRKFSEPAHRSSSPIKPIIKYSRSLGAASSANVSLSRALPSQELVTPISLLSYKNNVPLSLASRNNVPLCIGPSYSKSSRDSFWSPGWRKSNSKDTTVRYSSTNEGDDYVGDWSKERDLPATPLDRPSSAVSSTTPPTPLTVPALRSTYSQALPSLSYPSAPHNTIRIRRPPTPSLHSENERGRSTIHFPSRPSFTFSPPNLPSPSNFPLPPSPGPFASFPTLPVRSRAFSMPGSAPAPHASLSSRPSLPTLPQRDPRGSSPPRRSILAQLRKSSKRRLSKSSKARKKGRVSFALSAAYTEHPPLERRPTPYREAVSSILDRVLDLLVAPFRSKSVEEKRERKERKEREKREKGKREEISESFRHFDDTFD